MNLDLSQFRKIKENKHSAILQHPAGHKIELSKNNLHPKHQKELSELPMHFDVGGAVPGEGTDSKQPTIIINNGQPQQNAPQQSPNYVENGNFNWDKYIKEAPDAPLQSKIDVLKKEQANQQAVEQSKSKAATDANAKAVEYNKLAAPQGLATVNVPPLPNAAIPEIKPANLDTTQPTQAPQDLYGTQAYYDNYTQGVGEQKRGIEEQARAESQQGKEQQGILQSGIESQQNDLKNYQQHNDELTKEYKTFLDDYQNQHVDPSHYMSSLNTSQKVMTTIGLILGGIGGGLTHQENPALKYLNNQIDRDIESQKTEIDKKNNLLSANLHQFGNLRDATNMTKAMQLGIVSSQLQQAAAKATDPMSKARALQASGILDQQAAPILSQMAMKKTLLGKMQNGGIDPAQVIRMVVPQGQQEAAYKEYATAQELMKARDNSLRIFDQMDQNNTIGNRIKSPLQTARQSEAAIDIVAVELARDAAGRVNEYEFKAAKALFPKPGDSADTVQKKRQDILNLVQKKMNPGILSGYGINPFMTGGSRYNEQGKKKIELGEPQLTSAH